MFETIRLLATLIAIASGMVGGGIAVYNYMDDVGKRLDDRKKQTFQLATLYYSDQLVRARKDVIDAIETGASCNPRSPLYVSKDKVNLFTHVEFFDVVETCIENKLCDGETARQFFSAYANWHWPALKDHIQAVRDSEANMKAKTPYGYGLEKLASAPATAWAEQKCAPVNAQLKR